MYVLFEGVDTSGKTTQLQLLSKKFDFIFPTKEPGGTEFGKWAREILLNGKLISKEAEVLLFLADRAEHYQKIVKPNRKEKLVISDRGFISGIAYAIVNGNYDFKELLNLNLFALQNEPPELVIFFEIDENTLKKRLNTKEKDEIEKRGVKFILEVQDKMKDILKKLNLEYEILDASKSIDEVNSQIFEILKKRGSL